jgi:hypothetical protein
MSVELRAPAEDDLALVAARPRPSRSALGNQWAISVARDSRTTVTRIWPG